MLIMLRIGGELIIKAKNTRARFVKQLINNVHSVLSQNHIDHKIFNKWSRIYVETDDPRTLILLKNIFGIVSYSLIEHRCKSDFDTIIQTGITHYADYVKDKTFGLNTRRSGKGFSFNSNQINIELGARLNEHAKGVNLNNPEAAIYIEIREEETFFYTTIIQGAQGFPIGVGGKTVCLMSGGFDSPVAAWFIQRRGIQLEYVFCNLAGKAYERSVLRTCKVLGDQWSHGYSPRIHIIDFEPVVKELREKVKPHNIQVILKRMFYRAAEIVAKQTHCDAIVTGEAVGQVSTQTLKNLKAIEDSVSLPVLRPVITMEKFDIIELTRKIGTHDISSTIQEYCDLAPKKPNTGCSISAARHDEDQMDLSILENTVNSRRTIFIKSVLDQELAEDYIFTETIPDNAEIMDVRPSNHFDHWHYPNAKHYELGELLKEFKQLDKTKTYVLYCPFGTQSAVAAEEMQKAGYQAYSFKGGTRMLKKYLNTNHI